MYKKVLSLFLLFFVFQLFITKAQAAENSYVTIVNPQRIAEYTTDYMASFQAEKDEIISRNLPATWPVTYDVLLRADFVKELRALPENQELGLFLEIGEKISADAGVVYNKSDSWHRANSLFLSGYTQSERKKLIDVYFSKFKKEFGYYPKSVGAWWVDAYSLDYMHEKYKITGVLGMSDQYNLDGYSLWGTWWSVPYYPSKFNAALPAQTEKNKLEVVTQRWAPREPLNGYAAKTTLEYEHKSEVTPSLFSLQDYGTLGLPDSYFSQLLKTYAVKQPYNQFGHAVIGLEGDLKPLDYSTYFAQRLDIVKALENSNNITILTMGQFSSWYMKTFPNLSPSHIVESSNLLATDSKRATWIQTPSYRLGIVSDPEADESKIIDYRSYNELLPEPYLVSPNNNFSLSINLPFIIDSVILPTSVKNTQLGMLKTITANTISFNKGDLLINNKSLTFPDNSLRLTESKIPKEGIVINDFSLTIPFAIKHRLPFPIEPVLIGGIILAAAIISLFKKRVVVLLFGFVLILGIGSVILLPGSTFYISPTEMDGLKVLKQMPEGKILVYDKDCFDCVYQTKYKPAAMAGKKAYVGQLSGKKTDVNMSFVVAKTSSDARKILKDKGITYVYLSRYEDYIESLPYLPQDLNLERVYENANTEIYKIKN